MKNWERQIIYTEKRFDENKKQRVLREENLKKGNWQEVDDPKRIQFRWEQHTMRSPAAVPLEELNVYERIIHESQLKSIHFLFKGTAVSHAVGRIVIRDQTGTLQGYGTGFMVSPRLVMTNHHVLESTNLARNSIIQFNYHQDPSGEISNVEEFTLSPDLFFLKDEYLDFALVAVNPIGQSRKAVRDFGWMRLFAQSGKALYGERVNVIQHPGGRPKEVTVRENKIIDVPDEFLHYETDTEPGSSGSPVLNDLWEVAALHHSGVPERKNGNIMQVDGLPWDGSRQTIHLIKWKANEGVRISSIVKHIQQSDLSEEERQLFNEAFLPNPHIEALTSSLVKKDEGLDPKSGMRLEPDGSVTWFMKLNFGPFITQMPGVIGKPAPISEQEAAVTKPIIETPGVDIGAVEEEAISIDPDYSNRQGYDPEFFGTGDLAVPFPGLSEEMKAKVAINQQAPETEKYVLPYHHYSVIMNSERRLAYLTAVNIDGRIFRQIKRDDDKWYIDPRIKRSEQIDNELYKKNMLDRGHLVRRLDPSWGENLNIAKVGNDDTFHYTNCAPQHESFNRSDRTWQGLEDYILENADAKDLKVLVFTGPIFRDEDPVYRNIKLPREYWKIVVMVKPGDKLHATAYLLSQETLLDDLEVEFVYGKYKTFQVPVRKIENLTGFDFGRLSECDPLAGEAVEVARELSSRESLILK